MINFKGRYWLASHIKLVNPAKSLLAVIIFAFWFTGKNHHVILFVAKLETVFAVVIEEFSNISLLSRWPIVMGSLNHDTLSGTADGHKLSYLTRIWSIFSVTVYLSCRKVQTWRNNIEKVFHMEAQFRLQDVSVTLICFIDFSLCVIMVVI